MSAFSYPDKGQSMLCRSGVEPDGSVLVSFADDKSIKPDVQQCRLSGQAHRYALWLACGHAIRMTKVPHQWLYHELLLHSIELT